MEWITEAVLVVALVLLSYKLHDLERRLGRLEEKLNGGQMLERLHAVEKRIYPRHD